MENNHETGAVSQKVYDYYYDVKAAATTTTTTTKRNLEIFCYRKYKSLYAPDIWHQQQNNNNHNNDEKLFILNFRLFALCSQRSHLLDSMNRTRGNVWCLIHSRSNWYFIFHWMLKSCVKTSKIAISMSKIISNVNRIKLQKTKNEDEKKCWYCDENKINNTNIWLAFGVAADNYFEHTRIYIPFLSCYFLVKIHFLSLSKSVFLLLLLYSAMSPVTDVYVMLTLNTISPPLHLLFIPSSCYHLWFFLHSHLFWCEQEVLSFVLFHSLVSVYSRSRRKERKFTNKCRATRKCRKIKEMGAKKKFSKKWRKSPRKRSTTKLQFRQKSSNPAMVQ